MKEHPEVLRHPFWMPLTVKYFCLPVLAVMNLLPWPRGYKTFFMLNSTEHEILNAHKYKIRLSLGPVKHRMLFFPLIYVTMPTIVGILTFMSRKKFMLS